MVPTVTRIGKLILVLLIVPSKRSEGQKYRTIGTFSYWKGFFCPSFRLHESSFGDLKGYRRS